MPRRASKWILHEEKDGTWELTRGGRSMYAGMRSRKEALARLKNHYRPGEPVVHEDTDGYRTNITDQLKKSGHI